LRDSQCWIPTYSERIEVICGNMSQPLLGLSESQFTDLSASVDLVINCAQQSSWILDYRAYRPVNVSGLVELVRLTSARALPLHHLFTVGVFYSPEAETKEALAAYFANSAQLKTSWQPPVSNAENDPLPSLTELTPNFIKSKIVAEMILASSSSGFESLSDRFFVYRPEPYTFAPHSTRMLRTVSSARFFERFVKSLVQLGACPSEGFMPDWTPIDFVADTLVALVSANSPEILCGNRNEKSRGSKVFHIVNPRKRLSYAQFAQSVLQFGFAMEPMTMDAFLSLLQARASATGQEELALAPVFLSMDARALFIPSPLKLFSNAQSMLATLQDIPSVLPFKRLLHNYLLQFLKQNYLTLNQSLPHTWTVQAPTKDFLLPVITVTHRSAMLFLTEIGSSRWALEQLILTHGGVLFKRSPVTCAPELEKVSRRVYGGKHMLHDYKDGISPRSPITGTHGVFTSTEFSPLHSIPLHNEMSYSHRPPSKIMFYCAIAPKRGEGETPIASSKLILEDILKRVPLRGLVSRNLTYLVRLPMSGGLGRSWQATYQARSKVEVEGALAPLGVTCDWEEENTLLTKRSKSFSCSHPVTGMQLWSNHLVIFHPASLPPEVRAQFQRNDQELEQASTQLAKDCTFDNGDVISDKLVLEISALTANRAQAFVWEEGDLLLLDNLMTAHGRRPFTGPRQILVTLSI
jgi:thioester reductase-like protein/alpha-ketoglutarate-dependent taurine dioxygenase